MASERVRFMVLVALAALTATPRAFGDEVRFEQKLSQQMPNADVLDERGASRKFLDLSNGRPSILVFAYNRCPNLCSLVMNALVDSLRSLPQQFGKDYRVATLSIDPKETPSLSFMKMRSYLARLGATPADYPAGSPWHFLTAAQPQILKLTAAAGFYFSYDPVSKEYRHPSGIVVLTPSGKISRYFFGIRYPAKELAQALRDAAKERQGSLAERILLYCFHYDPTAGRYSVRILSWLRLVSLVCVLAFVALLGVSLARKKKESPS